MKVFYVTKKIELFFSIKKIRMISLNKLHSMNKHFLRMNNQYKFKRSMGSNMNMDKLLMISIKKNESCKKIEEIIDHGANMNIYHDDSDGESYHALEFALKYHSPICIVSLLLKKGCSMECKRKDMMCSILNFAISCKCSDEIIRLFIGKGYYLSSDKYHTLSDELKKEITFEMKPSFFGYVPFYYQKPQM